MKALCAGTSAVAAAILLCSAAPVFAQAAPQNGPADLPGTRWSPDQIRTAVAGTRAGGRVLPKSWPNGAKVAVVISFDVDNETWMLPSGRVDLGSASDNQYGATEGLPRILKLLDDRKLPATFFVPAAADIISPQILPSIVASGRHEVAIHGWIHENVAQLNNAAEEERLTRQAYNYIKEKTGKAPLGMRTGGWNVSPYTINIAQKLGLVYDSSMMAWDSPYHILTNGQDSGVIELPVTWVLDDAPYVSRTGSLPSPELLFKVYRDEFDMAYEEGGTLMLTFHPQLVRRSRFSQLRSLIEYMESKQGVWFTTAGELAQYVKANSR